MNPKTIENSDFFVVKLHCNQYRKNFINCYDKSTLVNLMLFKEAKHSQILCNSCFDKFKSVEAELILETLNLQSIIEHSIVKSDHFYELIVNYITKNISSFFFSSSSILLFVNILRLFILLVCH